MSKAFSCFTHGLHAISDVSTLSDSRGAVIYAFVHQFEKLLDHLTVKSSANANESAVQRSSSQMINTVSQLLNAMLLQLEPEDTAQKELFEGFMNALIERAGSLLHLYTFGFPAGATIEANIELHEQVDPSSPSYKFEMEELRNFIAILERAVSLAPHFLEAHPGRKSKPKASSKAGPNRSSLLPDSRERVQQTLIRAIFGEDQSEAFECLKAPVPTMLKQPALTMIEDGNKKQWFTKQIWRLLGWEILADSTAW
jgi:hypothetical protein